MTQGVEIAPIDELRELGEIGVQQPGDGVGGLFGVVQEEEVLEAPDVVEGADDEVVVPALQGQGRGAGVLVGLAQLDALVKAGAPPGAPAGSSLQRPSPLGDGSGRENSDTRSDR